MTAANSTLAKMENIPSTYALEERCLIKTCAYVTKKISWTAKTEGNQKVTSSPSVCLLTAFSRSLIKKNLSDESSET